MASRSRLRILVVEDEILVSLMIEDMLVDLGCEVAGSARSVAEALALVARETFDGAILDLNLGGVPAYPVADALTARAIPFVFLTGYGTGGIDRRFADTPMVSKPFHQAALEEAIGYFTGAARA